MGKTTTRMLAAALVLATGLTVAWAAGAAGDLDTSFGTSGVADGGAFWVYHAATLSDGSVVLAGQDRTESPYGYAVKKLNPTNGSPDTAFGDNGNGMVLVFGPGGPGNAQLNALTVGPDDTIYVGGRRIVEVIRKGKRETVVTSGSVLALDPDDGAVTGFGSSGYLDTDATVLDIATTGTSSAYDLTISTLASVSVTTEGGGGKGKKGGGSTTTSSSAVGLVRCDQDGTLDSSFGSGGVVADDLSADSDDLALYVAVDTSGRTVVLIDARSRTGGDDERYLARYDADGYIDTSFGSSGYLAVTDLGTVTDIAIDGDGASILVAAHEGPDKAHTPTVVRFDADGSATPDTTFDIPTLTSGDSSDTRTLDLVVDANDRVCVGLWFGYSSNDFTVVRCNADGTRDNSFGPTGNGVAEVVDLATQDQPLAFAQDADGNVVAGAIYDTGSGIETRVVRWLGGS